MKYFALLTTYGEKVLAEATALGTKIELTQMAVGDGGGSLPAPDTKQTKLINEKRRAAINTLFIDSVNTNQIIAEQVIPENEGGWWIREIGLFDKSGLLVAVANCPETYKPLLAEGSGRTQTIRMILIVSHTEAVTLKVDPAIVLATRGYVDDSVKHAIEVHAKSRNHPDASTGAKGFVQLADVLSADNNKAVTPKLATEINQRAVNAQTSANTANTAATNANNNANGRVPSGRKVNNKPLTTDINLTAGDVGAYTKAETDTKVADAKKAGTDAQATANTANTAATNANNNANGRVPSGRKVNNKPLTEDINLAASDVGAYTKAETDTKVADAKKAGMDAQATANTANTAATNANNNANGRVPSGRKVNNKPLSADIALNAGDVGAYTKAEVDSKISNIDNINTLYPVGIVVWFAQNKDPNTLFPNTKWQYIGENKTIRLANRNGANILQTGGSDSVTLTEAQVPVHNHAFSATTSSFDYGTKSTNSSGAHTHTVSEYPKMESKNAPANGGYRMGVGVFDKATSSSGAHTHTVAIGAHTHTVSGTTGNKGGGAAITVTNAYIMLMGWYRLS